MVKKNSKFKTLMCVAREVKSIKGSKDPTKIKISYGELINRSVSAEDTYRIAILSPEKGKTEFLTYSSNGSLIQVERQIIDKNFNTISKDRFKKAPKNITDLIDVMPRDDFRPLAKVYLIDTLSRMFDYKGARK